MFYRTILKMSFLPPLLNILLVAIGLLLMRRHPRLGLSSCLVGVISLYLLSTWPVANGLLRSVEVAPALSSSQWVDSLPDPGKVAIVVLGAGQREVNTEYGSAWPDTDAMQRLNYAAYLYQQMPLPILVTGGKLNSDHASADVMAHYLETLFGIETRWIERQSHTTEENAELTYRLLAEEGIDTVVLVTQSVHMRRSIMLFEKAGFEVLPAPTALSEPTRFWWGSLVPRVSSLHTSSMAVHEWLGYFWYRLRGY